MSFYTGLAATSLRLINDKGRSITVKHSNSTYDPATDSYSAGTDTEAMVKGVFTNYTTQEIDETLIRSNDKKLLIAASGITKPDTGAKIEDGSDTYSIVNVKEIKPAGTAIIYILQVRR